MTTTTDPRTVTTGKVDVSRTSAAKRAALIGRRTRVTGLYDHPQGIVGTVESIDGDRVIVRFTDGTWCYAGRRLTLV